MKINKTMLSFFIVIFASTSAFGASVPNAAQALIAHVQGFAYQTCDLIAPTASYATARVRSYVEEWQRPALQGSTENLYVPFDQAQIDTSGLQKKISSTDSNEDSDADSEQDDEFEFIVDKKSIELPFQTPKEFNNALKSDSSKTIHKLNRAIENYYQNQNPTKLTTQTALLKTYNCLMASKPAMKLNIIIAEKFNERQRFALIDAIKRQAEQVEPIIKKKHALAVETAISKRDRIIAKANAQYQKEIETANNERDRALSKSKNKIKTFATNAQYINSCAQTTYIHSAHNVENFNDLETYQAFLETMRRIDDKQA